MHVDISLPLWAFWDIYGNTSKIRLMGSTKEPVQRFDSTAVPLNGDANQPMPHPPLSFQQPLGNSRNNNLPPIDSSRALQGPPSSTTTTATTMINVENNVQTQLPIGATNLNTNVHNGITRPTDNLLNTSFGSNSGGPSECTLCFENLIDCVLYTCGHMCMCYDCAIHQWKRGGGFCPLCRNEIRDVIKTFKS